MIPLHIENPLHIRAPGAAEGVFQVDEREAPTPAIWAVHPIETEGYPIPADMKDWGKG